MAIAPFDNSFPSEEESAWARESAHALAKLLGSRKTLEVTVEAKGSSASESVAIPESAARLLFEILNKLGQGEGVAIVPLHAELSTQEAAEVLNVSRPYVIKLIDEKLLPCKMVGTHRRILFSDLMNYKRAIDAKRLEVLDELAAQAQDLNMGY